ncbi:FMN-binding protein [Myxococcota bacterium]|nr:FMN-binding protein [Myxococcota bacterium]MBU1379273.1 FMN-binding protein [Myxococcota bacterium]MBU1499009.1 FMN-binding protein [Myxococcota bacterium]
MALAIHNWRKKSVILYVSEKKTSSKLASLAGLTTFPELTLSTPFKIKKSSLVILPTALPLTVFDNRFLTSEAFDNWKKIIGKDGTIMMSVPVPGTWISKPWIMAVSTLLSTVKLHFKNHAFIDCEGTWLVVSNRQNFDSFLKDVLSRNELKGYAALNTTLEPQLLRAPVSTQETPFLYIYTRAAFDNSSFSKFIARASSGTGKSFVFYKSSYFSFAIALLLLIFIFVGRRRSLSRENAEDFSIGTMVFFASCWAMALQIGLLINLQRVSGNLIVDAGLISGLFMLFFALAAQLAKRTSFSNISTPLWVMAISGFTIVIMFIFNSASINLWISAAISSASGFLTGGSVSSALTIDDRRGTSQVFSWDNAGAAFGSLIAGTILIQISGPSRTVLIMGILAGITAIPTFISFLDTETHHPLRSRTWPWPRTSLILAFGTIFILLVATAGRAPAPATGRQRAGENWITKPFLHCISENNGNKYLTVDSGAFPETLKLRGYAGPIRMKLTFDEKGSIMDIQIGENIETPSFIKKITPWVQNFRGKGPKDDLYSKETGVDTVSGATMSTKTIRDTVEITRAKVLEYLNLEYSAKKIQNDKFSFRSLFIIAGLFTIALFLSFLMQHKLLRLAFLVITTLTLGFIYNWTISIVDGGLFFLNAIPGPPGRLLMVGAAIAIAIAAGPLWCGILCPLGAFQELVYTTAHAFARLVGLYKGPIVSSTGLNNVKSIITTRASFLKYVILAAGIVMLAFTGNQKFTDWDPLSWFFSFSLTPWRIIAYTMIITSSLLLFRPHCRFICPVGAFFSLFNHIALLSRKLGIRKYPDCDYGVKGPSDITCIRCQRCCITKQKK